MCIESPQQRDSSLYENQPSRLDWDSQIETLNRAHFEYDNHNLIKLVREIYFSHF